MSGSPAGGVELKRKNTVSAQEEEGTFPVRRNQSSPGMAWLVTTSFLLSASTRVGMSWRENWSVIACFWTINLPPWNIGQSGGGLLEVATCVNLL